MPWFVGAQPLQTERGSLAMPMSVHLTPGRRAWLLRLMNSQAPLRRGQGPVGHDCMRAGWTEWAYVDAGTGEFVGNLTAAEARFGRDIARRAQRRGEMLTPAGRAIIEACPP
jgi:hypothetical protein